MRNSTASLHAQVYMRYFSLVFILFSSSVLADIDLVTVDKSENKMHLLDNGKVVKEYRVAFGENPRGHKEQEGDEKTPEGNYTLDYKKEDSSFYRAMHISYPNVEDTENAKANGVSAGGFIMVHGQRNWFGWLSSIAQKYNWTNGCIALTNSEMDEFMDLVKTGTASILSGKACNKAFKTELKQLAIVRSSQNYSQLF